MKVKAYFASGETQVFIFNEDILAVDMIAEIIKVGGGLLKLEFPA